MNLNLEKKFTKFSNNFDFDNIFKPTLTSKLLIIHQLDIQKKVKKF